MFIPVPRDGVGFTVPECVLTHHPSPPPSRASFHATAVAQRVTMRTHRVESLCWGERLWVLPALPAPGGGGEGPAVQVQAGRQ